MLSCGLHSREANGNAMARSSSRMDESDFILNCLANRPTLAGGTCGNVLSALA